MPHQHLVGLAQFSCLARLQQAGLHGLLYRLDLVQSFALAVGYRQGDVSAQIAAGKEFILGCP